MKYLTITSFVLLTIGLKAQSINEFHYDNTGTDTGEFVEIAIPDPQPSDLENYQITHYNGSGGAVLSSQTLDNLTQTCAGGICYYVWEPSSLQNSTEGLALSGPSGVIEFLSYEGTLTAVGGPADGLTSTDVNVTEGTGTPVGTSISKNSSGVWETGIAATPGSANTNTLPVELENFAGKSYADKISLSWTTSSEINNDFFEIQRSADASEWQTIGTVKGNGNTNSSSEYDFLDRSPFTGKNYYRLAQFDFNGSMEYHKIISVDLRKNTSTVFPVIAYSDINVKVEGDAKVSIYNAAGQRMITAQVSHSERIDLSSFEKGIYILTIENQGQIEHHRIIKP